MNLRETSTNIIRPEPLLQPLSAEFSYAIAAIAFCLLLVVAAWLVHRK